MMPNVTAGVLLLTSLAAYALMPDTSLRNVSEVAWSGAETAGRYLGSPSIIICGGRGLLAAHDDFGPSASNPRRAFTYGSSDGGVSWSQSGAVLNMYWATLFSRSADASTTVFMMGTSSDNIAAVGQVSIAASADCGATWSAAVELTHSIVPFSTGPTPVVEHAGRLWRAFEVNAGTGWASGYSAVVFSATANATSLLDPAAWVSSAPLPFSAVVGMVPPAWLSPLVSSSFGWLEGNAVVPSGGPSDAGISIVLRVNSLPAANKAALLYVPTPESAAMFRGWIDPFPGGMSKFTIRYDASTGLYVSLANGVEDERVTLPPLGCGGGPSATAVGANAATTTAVPVSAQLPCCSMTQQLQCSAGTATACYWCRAGGRNNVTLAVSPSLAGNWTVVATTLTDDTAQPQWMSQLMTGFQYLDWQFDDAGTGAGTEDLVVAVRAGYRGSQCYHNSNRLLFQRITQWRKLLPAALLQHPATTGAGVAT